MLALACDSYVVVQNDDAGPLGSYSLRGSVEDGDSADDALTQPNLNIDRIYATTSGQDNNSGNGNGNGNERGDTASEVQVWERNHRNRMLAHAEAYGQLFPQLDWILLGQRPMGFLQKTLGAARIAIPLTCHRDRCHTFLHETFDTGKRVPFIFDRDHGGRVRHQTSTSLLR